MFHSKSSKPRMDCHRWSGSISVSQLPSGVYITPKARGSLAIAVDVSQRAEAEDTLDHSWQRSSTSQMVTNGSKWKQNPHRYDSYVTCITSSVSKHLVQLNVIGYLRFVFNDFFLRVKGMAEKEWNQSDLDKLHALLKIPTISNNHTWWKPTKIMSHMWNVLQTFFGIAQCLMISLRQ